MFFAEVGFSAIMAAFESSSSSPPAMIVGYDIRELKTDLQNLKNTVDTIDTGGRHLENVERDHVSEERIQASSHEIRKCCYQASSRSGGEG